MLRNRWHNARHLGIQVISSHIFREVNCCADKLASMGHSIIDAVWLDTIPNDLRLDFYRDRCGLPNYRFPLSVFWMVFVVSSVYFSVSFLFCFLRVSV
jgi:hypothetical protein